MKLFKDKKDNYYFETFSEVIDIACQAAEKLNKFLHSFEADKISEYVEQLHSFENNADAKRHELCNKLIREFITPIEREDISALSQALDNIVDSIDDIIRKIYMFNIREMREDALKFSEHILNMCNTFSKLLGELYNFKKSKKLQDFIIDINTIENDADKLHAISVKKLFSEEISPNLTLAWTIIFDAMEHSIDSCETAADMISSITTKNS